MIEEPTNWLISLTIRWKLLLLHENKIRNLSELKKAMLPKDVRFKD